MTLAPNLSATKLTAGSYDHRVEGDLLPGQGGLMADVEMNFSTTDALDTRTARVHLCPVGDAPDAALSPESRQVWPLSKILLNSASPLAPDSATALSVSTSDGPVAVTIAAGTDPTLTLSPVAAFPPGRALTLDTSGMRDVLGRLVPGPADQLSAPQTTAVLTDLSFETAPAEGALVCSHGCAVESGALRIEPGAGRRRGQDALLALPATSATRLRVRASLHNPRSYSAGSAVMAVVGPHGERSELATLAMTTAPVDTTLELPAVSPLWLVIHVEGHTSYPRTLPPPPAPVFFIHELELL